MSIRLRQIALVANKLAPVIDDLKAVFGLEVCYIDPGVGAFGLENSLLPVGNNFIEVVAPIKDGTAAAAVTSIGAAATAATWSSANAKVMRRSSSAASARSLDEHPNRVGARERRLSRDAVASGGHRRHIFRNRLGREGRARGQLGARGRKRMARKRNEPK